MKKILFLFCFLLVCTFVKAQDIGIVNTSCQPVRVAIFGDPAPGCGARYASIQYLVNPGFTLKLSMFTGGTYPPVTWTTGVPAPGSLFSAVKVYDPGMAWGAGVTRPCLGPTTFGPQPGCGAQANSTWGGLVVVNVF